MFRNINKLIQLMEDPDHPSLRIVLPILKFTGLWHSDLKSLKPRLKLIMFFIIIAFFISQYIKCVIFFKIDSLELILKYAPFHIGVAKSCFFQKDFKSWKKLVEYISFVERKQSVEGDKEQDKVIKAYLQWSRRVTYFVYTLGFFANISIFSEPYRKNQTTENGIEYPYLFDGYTPFQREPPGYYCSMAIQTVLGYVMTMYIVTWDITIFVIMIFFVGQLRMCSLYCSRVIGVSVEESQRNIAECHEFHTTLVQYQMTFNALISPVMFIYLVIISVNLGVCIIQIAELEDDLPALMSGCVYIVSCLIQLLMFYWHANEVTEESERVSYSTFKSDWVDSDYRLQRQVALLAFTTSKRLTFTAGPFNDMSLATFITILRRSYSFYTLLKETK